MWYSRKYDNAKMPFSLFFHRGYAIHAGNVTKPFASHGCVRLAYKDAQWLWHLTQGKKVAVHVK
jgi:lipoprotein-anchoring transpeptidase ErfK/SrfK